MSSYTVKSMMNEALRQHYNTVSPDRQTRSFSRASSSSTLTLDKFTTGNISGVKRTVEKIQSLLWQGDQRTATQLENVRLFRLNNSELVGPIQQITSSLTIVNEESPADEDQLAKNLKQAAQVSEQLGTSAAWGVESMARDLAVFGLDLTAMNREPDELVQFIRDKSQEMLAALEKDASGGASQLEAKRRGITGASSRLVNGLSQGGRAGVVSGSVNSRVEVVVDGVKVNAGAIVSVSTVIVDPLVLDLNGDGIDLKGVDEGVDFDMNGDGQKNRMGFIRGDDALLFIDEYGDGVVRDGRQLFGNTDGYANGFEKLAAYDDNGDGVIDENDAIWHKLRVWVEKTEDGVCDADETMSLAEAGITSISIKYLDTREDDGKGNLIGQVGSFTRTDGSTGTAADVWFQESRADGEATNTNNTVDPSQAAVQAEPLPQPDAAYVPSDFMEALDRLASAFHAHAAITETAEPFHNLGPLHARDAR